MKLDAIVFDLDDTLLDTHQLLVPIAQTKEFFERISKPLPLMPGALQNLQYLKTRYPLLLLTFGDEKVQRAKVSSLNIANFFQEMYFADPKNAHSKKDFFQKIKKQYPQFLSVGNRRSTDIREAKLVGGLTCLFHYGEHVDEQVEQKEDLPDFEITTHQELIQTCHL